MDKSSYIYRHLKPSGEVFYIGIGKAKNFKRAHSKYKRSKFWLDVVSKHGYEVQILKKGLSWKDACELEKILINYYGRRDLGKGTLVNLTDGGDGLVNPSFEERARRSKVSKLQAGVLSATWGRKHTEEEKLKMRGKRESISGKNHPQFGKKRPEVSKLMSERVGALSPNFGKVANNVKIVLDIETGVFYSSAKEASLYYNIEYSNLKKYLNGTYNTQKINLRYV